jgi:hypothetical protein
MAARHQPTRHAREQQYQRLTLIGAGVIVAIVVILLGIGWYQSYVRPYSQTVITVGSMRADMTYFIKVLKQILPGFGTVDPEIAVNQSTAAAQGQIEQQFVLLQRAPQAGVTVSEQDIDEALGQDLGVVAINGSPPDRVALEAGLRNRLETTGLTITEYRQAVRAKVLRERLQAKLSSEYPKTGPAAKYEEIILNREDDANKLLARINGGDAWDAVAADVQKDPGLGSVTPVDFQAKIEIDDKLADPLLSLSPGQHTAVVPTTDGRYVIARLIEKDDQRPISQDELSGIGPKLLSNWMDDQKKTLKIKDSLSDDQKVFALYHADYHPPTQGGPSTQTTSPPPGAVPPVGVPAQVPGLQDLPPGIATPAGGLVAPTIPAVPATPGR